MTTESDELFEPIDTEPTEQQLELAAAKERVTFLEAQLSQRIDIETGLRERLANLTIEYTVVNELYQELLTQRQKERVSRIKMLNDQAATLKQEYSKLVDTLRIEKAGMHQQLTNLTAEHQEFLQKFGKLRHDKASSDRFVSLLNADIQWLINLLNNGFQLAEIVGREINHDDVANARNKSVVLPSRLTKGKIKILF